MFFWIGLGVVFACVLGGYTLHGGFLHVLWQPTEFLVIGGAAVGAYIIANPKSILSATGGAFKDMLRGPKYTKENYLDLLSLLYVIFKTAKAKGMLSIEAHIENPEESKIFQQFPDILHDHHALTFLCDYLRLLTMGSENPHQLEALMDEEIETHHAERSLIVSAVQTMADGIPALGIVAAVLGVIITMGSITEPPEVLGHLIGGALVGTFLGVFLSYGLVGPIAASMKAVYEAEAKYFQCMRTGILAYMYGYAPSICVEFARKSLFSDVRPNFYEVENTVNQIPNQV